VILWDIDGTIVHSSQERLFFAYLRREGHTSFLRSALSMVRLALPVWRWYRMKLSYLRGRTVDEVAGWVEVCFDQHIRPALIPEAVAAITALKAAGVRQVLLSGAPMPLAEKTAGYLGLDDVVAGVPEIADRCYTGRMMGPYPLGHQKVVHAAEWLARHGFSWEETVAVADHYKDRFLLAKVRHAIVVGGNKRLHRLARSRGWPIVPWGDATPGLRPVLNQVLTDLK